MKRAKGHNVKIGEGVSRAHREARIRETEHPPQHRLCPGCTYCPVEDFYKKKRYTVRGEVYYTYSPKCRRCTNRHRRKRYRERP